MSGYPNIDRIPKDAKFGCSSLVDEAVKGALVTITRYGKLVAALVSVEVARKALGKSGPGIVACLRTFQGGPFQRNRTSSRDVDL